jgi:hypothetical protein
VEYRTYGLICACEWPLPEALRVHTESCPDVVFRPGAISGSDHHPTQVVERGWYRAEYFRDERIRFVWPGLFESELSADGSDVAVRKLGRRVDWAFTTHLFGHVLSFVLLKKGIEPLHSTVVGTPNGAIGILGGSGYGKSTLAAALLEAGLPLLTDDLLVLIPQSDELMAQPGLPRLKLWPEAAARFLPDASSEPMAPGTPKRIYPLEPPSWTAEPRPLQALYVLRRPVTRRPTSRVTIRSIPPAKALIEVTRSTFNSILVNSGRLRGQFEFATDLATRLPVRSLTYPPGFQHLPHVVERLLHDASRQR